MVHVLLSPKNILRPGYLCTIPSSDHRSLLSTDNLVVPRSHKDKGGTKERRGFACGQCTLYFVEFIDIELYKGDWGRGWGVGVGGGLGGGMVEKKKNVILFKKKNNLLRSLRLSLRGCAEHRP